MDLSKLLQLTIDKSASDLHMVPGYYPTIRINGELFQLSTLEPITSENNESVLIPILNQLNYFRRLVIFIQDGQAVEGKNRGDIFIC